MPQTGSVAIVASDALDGYGHHKDGRAAGCGAFIAFGKNCGPNLLPRTPIVEAEMPVRHGHGALKMQWRGRPRDYDEGGAEPALSDRRESNGPSGLHTASLLRIVIPSEARPAANGASWEGSAKSRDLG